MGGFSDYVTLRCIAESAGVWFDLEARLPYLSLYLTPHPLVFSIIHPVLGLQRSHIFEIFLQEGKELL